MEDFIMKEIDKIGKMIEAILLKIGFLKNSGDRESVSSVTKIELAEKLDMDIDELVNREDFTAILINEYGFSNTNLEKFAELMMDFVEAAPDDATAGKYAAAVLSIYNHLHESASGFSFNSYYILEKLKRYI